MQTFRILYFRQSVLERTETVDGRDILDAIDKASASRRPDLTTEIWSPKGKVGIIGPSPTAKQGDALTAAFREIWPCSAAEDDPISAQA